MKKAAPNRRGAHAFGCKAAQIPTAATVVFGAFHGEELPPIICGLKLISQGDKGVHASGCIAVNINNLTDPHTLRIADQLG